jgi:hypothetical protein
MHTPDFSQIAKEKATAELEGLNELSETILGVYWNVAIIKIPVPERD